MTRGAFSGTTSSDPSEMPLSTQPVSSGTTSAPWVRVRRPSVSANVAGFSATRTIAAPVAYVRPAHVGLEEVPQKPTPWLRVRNQIRTRRDRPRADAKRLLGATDVDPLAREAVREAIREAQVGPRCQHVFARRCLLAV